MFGGNSFGELEFSTDSNRNNKGINRNLVHEPQRQVKNLEKFLGLQDDGPGSPTRDVTELSALESLPYQREISWKESSGRKDLSKFLGVSETSSSQSQPSKLESFQRMFTGLKKKMAEKRCIHKNVNQQIIGDGSLSTFEKRTKSLPRKLKLVRNTPKDYPTIQNSSPQKFYSLKIPIRRASAKSCHPKQNSSLKTDVTVSEKRPDGLNKFNNGSIKGISGTMTDSDVPDYSLPKPPPILPGPRSLGAREEVTFNCKSLYNIIEEAKNEILKETDGQSLYQDEICSESEYIDMTLAATSS